jgi:hypothetical protein
MLAFVLYRCAFALALAVGPAMPARAAEPDGTPETPYPGITYTRWRDARGPVRIHVIQIDLSSQEIDLVATAPDQRGKTPSAFAAAVGAAAAVNGDYFNPSGFAPAGLARGESTTWAGTRDDSRSGVISFFKNVDGTRLGLSPPDQVVEQLEERIVGAVSGRPLLVQGGSPLTSFPCDDAIAMACDVAPRTAAALSADGRTLWLVVVDGWQPESAGMTAAQLARFLSGDLGAAQALLLDGGSASAMTLDGRLVSAPSDGAERPVANHLAVHYGSLPPGTLKGVVKERNVETGDPIAGAVVRLDDGRTATFDGDSLWLFEVPPRWACATASAPGYRPNTVCRQVTSGQEIYGSIALFPDSDFPDGGPGPADASPDPDAGGDPPGSADAAASDPDAGSPEREREEKGCAAAGGADPRAAALLLAVLLLPRRRRPPRAARTRPR